MSTHSLYPERFRSVRGARDAAGHAVLIFVVDDPTDVSGRRTITLEGRAATRAQLALMACYATFLVRTDD